MREAMYGFVKYENMELPGIICGYKFLQEKLAVAEVTESVYKGLSARMMELELPKDNYLDYKAFMKEMDCQFLLLVWNEQEEERLYFFSNTKRVRALEFLDYLIPEFGLVKGDAEAAGGRIASAILKVQMSGIDLTNPLEYFLRKAASYFEDCDCIQAGEYGKEYADHIPLMKQYVKKRIPWAFVKSTEIVKAGEIIRIKSLENESGIEVTADSEVYIMIGCRGEVYDMKKEKFERTYEVTDEALDVFEQMLDFLPEAEVLLTGEFVSLDEMAHLCYPKAGAGIYAEELENRTKVFPAGDGQEYYLGRPGDYLAIRPEDFCDIYVIQSEIFRQTYEEKE